MGEGDALCLETHQLLERCGRRQRAWCSEVMQRRCKGDANIRWPGAVGARRRGVQDLGIDASGQPPSCHPPKTLRHSDVQIRRQSFGVFSPPGTSEAGVWAKRPDRVLVSERLGPENRKSQSTAEVSVAPAGDRQDAASRPAEPNCPAMPSSC